MLPAALLAELEFPQMDPVLVDVPGPIDIRWYGLMYVAGFAMAYVALRHLSRRGEFVLPAAQIGDLLWALALGVIVGGRLGYLLFYGWADVRANPLGALRIWEGGMSFHGGLAGVAIAAAVFAHRRDLPFLHLGDALALATPFGLFAVRVANFVNGELYGRIASPGLPWGVRFPTDPVARRLLGAEALGLRARERRILAAYDSGLWDAIRAQVPLRHPSQLYEALGEGVLLALLLWGVRWWRQRNGAERAAVATRLDGLFAGLFLIGYATVRIVVEQFRQPDAQFRGPGDPLGTVLGPFTMGQVLSAVMVGGGVLILWLRGRADPQQRTPRGDSLD